MPRFNYELISDEELLLLIKDDNTLAFKALFNRYYRPLCKFISIYVSDEALSEEIISDVLVSLWELRSRSTVRNVKHYLFIAARNQSFNRARKKKMPLTYSDTLEVYDNLVSDGTSPLSIIGSRETQKEILNLIDSLPLRQREVLLMSRISGIKNEEIAAVLGISLKTVQSTLYEAVREMRTKLSQSEQS